MQTLTLEQAGKFLKSAEGERLYAMFVVAIWDGLRMGELMGLKWTDIDFDEGTMAIQRGMVEIKGKAASRAQDCQRAAEDSPDRCEPSGPVGTPQAERGGRQRRNPWVFCDRNGSLLRKSDVRRRAFARILSGANEQAVRDAEKKGAEPERLPTIRFHDLTAYDCHDHASTRRTPRGCSRAAWA